VVAPFSVCTPSSVVSNASRLYPWMGTSTAALNTPYANGAVVASGPFSAQVANIAGGLVDFSNISFQSTLSALENSGSVSSTVFY